VWLVEFKRFRLYEERCSSLAPRYSLLALAISRQPSAGKW
jgi:hypothetical protein